VVRNAAGRSSAARLLPRVLTLPAAVSEIAYYNKAVIHGLLFDMAAETLHTIAADPKHLGRRSRHARAAHLGLSAHASSPRSWHRTRWWLVPRIEAGG
jgi:hypothetical protein